MGCSPLGHKELGTTERLTLRYHSYAYFTDEETEAQGSQITTSRQMAELGNVMPEPLFRSPRQELLLIKP